MKITFGRYFEFNAMDSEVQSLNGNCRCSFDEEESLNFGVFKVYTSESTKKSSQLVSYKPEVTPLV